MKKCIHCGRAVSEKFGPHPCPVWGSLLDPKGNDKDFVPFDVPPPPGQSRVIPAAEGQRVVTDEPGAEHVLNPEWVKAGPESDIKMAIHPAALEPVNKAPPPVEEEPLAEVASTVVAPGVTRSNKQPIAVTVTQEAPAGAAAPAGKEEVAVEAGGFQIQPMDAFVPPTIPTPIGITPEAAPEPAPAPAPTPAPAPRAQRFPKKP